MAGEKDSKNRGVETDITIKNKISKGLSSGIKKTENTPYALTDKATSDFKKIFNHTLDKEGFEKSAMTFAAWCNVFEYLSKNPDYGKDASHYAHGLKSHLIPNMNKHIYFIAGQDDEIIVVRILENQSVSE